MLRFDHTTQRVWRKLKHGITKLYKRIVILREMDWFEAHNNMMRPGAPQFAIEGVERLNAQPQNSQSELNQTAHDSSFDSKISLEEQIKEEEARLSGKVVSGDWIDRLLLGDNQDDFSVLSVDQPQSIAKDDEEEKVSFQYDSLIGDETSSHLV